jgi:serine/threonine-protein phosphatase 2A regulatory subunit A
LISCILFLILAKTDDLDQVLLCMSRKLGDFVPYIGGPTQAKVLIPLFETLLNMEETQVRAAAADSVSKVLTTIGPEHKNIAREFLEMYKRLVVDDGGEVFYGRVSACQIAPQLYLTLQDVQDKTFVREAYAKMSGDELSIIKRATVAHLIAFATNSDADTRVGELLTILKHLVFDECASVKIMAVEILPAYSKLLFEMKAFDTIVQEIGPLVKVSTEDSSWRVKSAIAKQFGVYASVFPQENVLQIYRCGVALMVDDEPEVRQLMVPNIFVYCSVVGLEQYTQALVPMLQLLFDDPIPEVRKAVADLVVESAMAVGTESSANVMADLIVKMLTDEDGCVRLRVLAKLPRIAEEIPNLLTRITPVLKTLYNDSNWRVRRAVAEGMPGIVASMGPEFFQNHFMTEYLQTLKDGVSEVRVGICETFPHMIEACTGEWFFTNIFATVKLLIRDEYLVRLSMIGGLRAMLRATSALSESHQGEVLIFIFGLTKDPVPNIRLRAAQALASICDDPNTDSNRMQQIKPVMQELQADKDKDVKFFASAAFK